MATRAKPEKKVDGTINNPRSFTGEDIEQFSAALAQVRLGEDPNFEDALALAELMEAFQVQEKRISEAKNTLLKTLSDGTMRLSAIDQPIKYVKLVEEQKKINTKEYEVDLSVVHLPLPLTLPRPKKLDHNILFALRRTGLITFKKDE